MTHTEACDFVRELLPTWQERLRLRDWNITLEFVDAEVLHRDEKEEFFAWTTSDPGVVGWKPTDRVRMVVRPGEKHLFVHLWSADPDFDHFEAAVDGGPWERLPEVNVNEGPRFGWSAKRLSMGRSPGVHEARARLVRRAGTRGPESFVRLRVP